MSTLYTPAERISLALAHQEADRVPFFLPLTIHCARDLGLTPQEYFSQGKNVAEGQLRAAAKYRFDCLSASFYASLELEAWGGSTIFHEDAPPNAGPPIVEATEKLLQLQAPDVKSSTALQRGLETIRILKANVGQNLPIMGAVISPLSFPIIQLGFDRYLDILHDRPDLCNHLLRINEEFCLSWAKAQLAAGASAIAYVDPMASSDLITKEMFLKTGFPIAKRIFSALPAPVSVALASARSMGNLDLFIESRAVAVTVSAKDDLAAVKAAAKERIGLIGNLNGIEMRNWDNRTAERKVKETLAAGAIGGGFILSENHGEIPAAVSEETLSAISEAVLQWGQYPLRWLAK